MILAALLAAASACEPVPEPVLEGQLTVELARAGDVSEAELEALGAQLVGWWEARGLTLGRLDGGVEAPGPVLAGDGEALRALDPSDVEAAAALVDAIYAPLTARLAETRPDRVRVLAVRRMAAPGSPAARWFGRMPGLTLSPALLAALPEGDPSRALAEAVAPDGAWGPLVVLAVDDLASLPRDRAARVPAHELGHALGLPHHEAPGNLMSTGASPCPPRLSADQAAALRLPEG